MSGTWLNTALDVLVAALLLFALPSFYLLSRRLRALQMGQDGMRQLIEALNVATEQARRAISDLKLAAAHAGQEVDGQIKSARQIADDLALMVEAGDNLAAKLEGSLALGRLSAGLQPASRASAADADYPEEALEPQRGPRAETERDVLRNLKSIR